MGLPGFTINLTGTDGSGNAVNLNATTDANGNYSFNVAPGIYTVTEVCPAGAGWRQSFPGPITSEATCGANGYAITLTSGQVDSNNDFGNFFNFQNAIKSGLKFLDINADGVRDPDGVDNIAGNADDEVGLPGFTINLTGTDGSGNAVNLNATTDVNGNYSFSVAPGIYTVTEVCPAGAAWRQSFPGPITSVATCGANGYAITLTSGQVDSNNDFGNFQSASKSGLKFLDINADGVRDPDGLDNIAGNADDEVGLAGFTINLTGTDGSGNAVNLNATTDANGNYSFSVAPGIYTVTEVCPAGAAWRQSFPGPITSVATCGANGYAITLTSGQVDSNNDFGNFQSASKSGLKFLDINANGVRDPDGLDNIAGNADDEVGLAGFTINLTGTDGSGNAVNLNATTDANGNYSFSVAPGIYTVTEVCPAGAPWRQSFPGPITSVATCGANGYAITLTSGQVDSNNDFGNFQSASKSGLKFLDINANGVRDPDGVDNIAGNADDEVGLAGFTINLTGTDGSGNAVNLNATTDANGNYSFSVAPGIYTVTEVCPAGAGWRQSFPGPITSVATCGANGYAITLTSGQVDSNNDFGNFQSASKSGLKFLDLNANGVRDPDGVDNIAGNADDEVGLPGFTINLTGTDGSGNAVNLNATTDANGNYSFNVAPGIYTVTEVCPAGAPWRQSFPGPITSVATCGANGYAITLTSGQVDSNNDFGNFQSASKSGLKFLDINANGVRDPDGVDNIAGNADDEVGLPGFTINLTGTDGSGNAVNLNATTDANGNYSFNVAPGSTR